jgi:hypothetical protein
MTTTRHLLVFEDDNSAIYDIVDADGNGVGAVQEFKVDKDGMVPAASAEGEAVQQERVEAVVAAQDEAQAALEPDPEPPVDKDA